MQYKSLVWWVLIFRLHISRCWRLPIICPRRWPHCHHIRATYPTVMTARSALSGWCKYGLATKIRPCCASSRPPGHHLPTL